MTDNLACNDFRLRNCFALINDIAASNNYYFWIGDYQTHANATLQTVYDNTSNNLNQAYVNMIAGKKISSLNVFPMIPLNLWVTGTVYDMYDSSATDVPDSDFYVITTEGGFNHVWKVLDNNFGVPSTVMPSIFFITGTSYVQTADGYRWKYMTSVNTTTAGLFTTSGYFPLVANSTVVAGATPGSLDIFTLQSNGAFYNNYISGTLKGADIAVSGDQTLYNISNSVVSTVNGFYTGCLLYLTGGTGQGQYATVTDYVSNTIGNLIRIQNPFVTLPQNGTTFDITPQLKIVSGGLQTINCVARCLINALASNSIYRIESLQPGLNYFNVANTSVISNTVVGVSNNALVHAILGPSGGHGSNVFSELYSNKVGISVSLANTETSTVLATNIYQQIGLLKAPLFANVVFNLTSANGVFLAGETVYSVVLQQFAANVTVTQGSGNVSCNSANFVNQLVVGENIYVKGASPQLVTVNSIVNSSFITISSNALLSCTQSTLLYPTLVDSALVTVGGATPITVTNCTPNFSTGSALIGQQSGATGTIQSVVRNGISEYFGTFQELYKYNATLLNGTLQQTEVVSQGNNTASLYTVTGTGNSAFVYLSNFAGQIFGNGTITGATSGATANLTSGYLPDVIFGSGDILYIENINPVTRANTQTESFNILLSF